MRSLGDRSLPSRRNGVRSRRGQSLVETAISLPVLLLLALGVTDIGRSFYYREAVTNSVRQALRVAVSSSQQSTADSVCSGTASGPLSVTVTSSIPPAGGAIMTIANEAALESSSTGSPAGSVIAGARLSVTFHCLNGAAVTNATSNGLGPLNPGSDSVTATITDTMGIITPLLWPITGSSIHITVSSFQRSEY
jgi:Flp pilus assembly protein TadG